ncbi:MAG: hypothetical protein D6770_05565 [Anaerolineae bacterium]|nr:MAG: hypothetical protein D6770_05565 [Anaerolineae bacterium]
MEWLEALAAIVFGLAIRLALPIGLTALAVYLLQRLDEQWQEEARDLAARNEVSRPECWAIKGCPPERAEQCPVRESGQPCWQVFRAMNDGYLKDDCLTCDVFLQAPLPAT